MTSEINPVMLQAQNINLKQKLEAAESRISDLQLLVSQNTVHIYHNNNEGTSGNNNNSDLLESLKKKKNSPSSTTTSSGGGKDQQGLIDELRYKLTNSEERVAELERQLEAMRQEHERLKLQSNLDDFSSSGSMNAPPSPPSEALPAEAIRANSSNNSSSLLVQQQNEQRIEELEKDVSKLRGQIATSNADVFRWKSAHSTANNQLEKMKSELSQAQKELANEKSRVQQLANLQQQQQHGEDHVEQIKELNEELNAQLGIKVNELEDSQSENKRLQAAMGHLKEELKASQGMVVQSTQKIGKLTAEMKKVQAAAAQTGAGGGGAEGLKKEVAELSAKLEAVEFDSAAREVQDSERISDLEAETESLKNTLAQMEKDAAEKEQAIAEAEFDRLLEGDNESAEAALRKDVQELQAQLEAMKKERDTAISEHAIMLKLKDKTLLQLSQTSEELTKSREHFQKREKDLLAQIAALQQQHEQQQQQQQKNQQQQQAGNSSQQQQKQQQKQDANAAAAAAAGIQEQEKLQRERDGQEKEKRKNELLERLKKKTRTDQSNAEAIFRKTASAYDTLLKNLREAFSENSGKGQEEVYYDVLWDYEVRLYHLENDLKSMRTIVDMRSHDMENENRRVKENYENLLAILRMQIVDLGKTPQC